MRAILFISIVFLAAQSAGAALVTWTGDVNDDWLGGTNAVDTNWDTDQYPAAGDIAVIGLNGTNVQLDADLSASAFSGVTISDGGPLRPELYINVSSGIRATNVGIAIAPNHQGYLEMQSAWLYGDFLQIGSADFANGMLYALGCTLQFTRDVVIGREKGIGRATMEVCETTFGSLIIGADNTLAFGLASFISGAANITNQLDVGVAGNGVLSIDTGCDFQSVSTRSGVELFSEGYISLLNSGWTLNGVLRLGVRGFSRMGVSLSGNLQATGLPGQPSIIIGEFAGADGELSVEEYGDATASVTAWNEAIVGWRALGRLFVGGFGSFSSDGLVIGKATGSVGAAEFVNQGYGSVQNTIVGDQGEGVLEVGYSAILNCRNVEVARQAGATGEVRILSSGRLLASESMFVGGSITNAGSTNALVRVFASGELVVTDQLVVYSNGTVAVRDSANGDGVALVGDGSVIGLAQGVVHIHSNGTIRGVGRVVGELRARGGLVEPGLSSGKLNVDGPFRLSTGGVLRVEIGGVSPGTQYDVIGVASNAVWESGQVVVVLTNGFAPTAGQTFKVVDAGSYSGGTVSFDFSQAGLSPGLTWNTSTFLADGTLRVTGGSSSTSDCDLVFTWIGVGGGNVELRYTGSVGTAYFVDAGTNLVTPAWFSVSTNLVLSSGVNTQFIGGVSTNPIRFFRLRCGTNSIPAP